MSSTNSQSATSAHHSEQSNNIDPFLQVQQIEIVDTDPSSTPPTIEKKRKLDSWIYQHGKSDRDGDKRIWICNHCTIFIF
jgi:hypothetical protein